MMARRFGRIAVATGTAMVPGAAVGSVVGTIVLALLAAPGIGMDPLLGSQEGLLLLLEGTAAGGVFGAAVAPLVVGQLPLGEPLGRALAWPALGPTAGATRGARLLIALGVPSLVAVFGGALAGTVISAIVLRRRTAVAADADGGQVVTRVSRGRRLTQWRTQ